MILRTTLVTVLTVYAIITFRHFLAPSLKVMVWLQQILLAQCRLDISCSIQENL